MNSRRCLIPRGFYAPPKMLADCSNCHVGGTVIAHRSAAPTDHMQAVFG